MGEPIIASATAARHEALFIALERLALQAEAIASRRPATPLPAVTRAAAETLLYDVRRLLGGRGLPAAGDDFASLATALGQALAGLEAFEARHSSWNSRLGCFAWHTGHEPLPVRRLRPELVTPAIDRQRQRNQSELRRKIMARLDERYEEGVAAERKRAANEAAAAPVSASADTAIPEVR